MSTAPILMARRKNIALVAHDNRKEELVQWAKDNLNVLRNHSLYATRATGQLLKHRLGLNVTLLECGPLGGDQQIGSRISEGQFDFLIFFSDPLETQPHDSDVKALLRITVVWNIPVACNPASADFIISSPLMSTGYERIVPDYSKYRSRLLGDSRSEPAGRPYEGGRAASQLRVGGYSPPISGVAGRWRQRRCSAGPPDPLSAFDRRAIGCDVTDVTQYPIDEILP